MSTRSANITSLPARGSWGRMVGGATVAALLVGWLMAWPALAQTQKEISPTGKIPETEQAVAEGKVIYKERCSFCHGLEGGGDGPVADYLFPRPRDFTQGAFKLHSTASGEVPTDEDLYRTISRGIPGTSMPAWPTLTPQERWKVLYYVKTFSDEFDPEEKPEMPPTGPNVASGPETIAKGKEVYEKAKCWECHGREGRADGSKATDLENDWGFNILPANLTKGWRYKGGTSVGDIYQRFTTGLDGTPMPSYADTFSSEERWQLAHYVRSLIKDERGRGTVVIKAAPVTGDLPTDPGDTLWSGAAPVDVPLSGQVIIRPRLQNPSVDLLTVRALFNEKAVAFLLEWDDPVRDVVQGEAGEYIEQAESDSYPSVRPYVDTEIAKPLPPLRDAVEIQFPLKPPQGPQRPHFLLGNRTRPVVLWQWQADAQQEGRTPSPVTVMQASGHLKPPGVKPEAQQTVTGRGVWKNGRWRVVVRRSLKPPEGASDVTFQPGVFTPIAFHVWDGSNGETGLMMSISSWYNLVLPSKTPIAVYVYTFLAVVLSGLFELYLVRKVK